MPSFDLALLPHPATPAPIGLAVAVRGAACGGGLTLTYELTGDLDALAIPAAAAPAPARRDGLWQHTCCELFVGVAGQAGYREFNFSPAGDWAAYAFSAYRQPAALPTGPAPAIALVRDAGRLRLSVELAADWLPVVLPADAQADAPGALSGVPSGEPPAGALVTAALQLGLTAVVETADGGLSYWALRHPTARPDFHHRDGFAQTWPLISSSSDPLIP